MHIMNLTGSPAHAGIDLEGFATEGNSARFPRTRGDRPARLEASAVQGLVPPHTRG